MLKSLFFFGGIMFQILHVVFLGYTYAKFKSCLPISGNDKRTPKSKLSSLVPACWKEILMLITRKELYNSLCYIKLYKNVL